MSGRPDPRRGALEERARHARRDLEELRQQIADGEIDPEAAAELRTRYESDLAIAEAELTELPQAATPTPAAARPAKARVPQTRRILVGAAVVLVVLTAGIVVIARSGDDTPPSAADPASAATLPADEGDAIAQLEAAVAAQPDNAPMRLALANLYFERRDYVAAMNHYSMLLSGQPTPQEAAVANARIGWMSYDGLGEPAMAVEFLEAAVAADPGYGEAKLFLGVVLLYGLEDPVAALPYLEEVLDLPDLPEELRPEVETMVEEARRAGGGG